MNKLLAAQIKQDIQSISLQRMQYPIVFLQPFSSAYLSVPFSDENFHSIKPVASEKTIVFVDGGNAEILKTPDYSLQFLRFAAVGFQGAKKIMQKKKEGYLLVSAKKIDKELYFITKGYGAIKEFPKLVLSAKDTLFSKNNERTKLAAVGELFRALYEIHFACSFIGHENVLVFDRALVPQNNYEEESFTDLYTIAKNRNAIICGLSKTTALLCNTGESVVSHLALFQKQGYWLYYPVFSTYNFKHNAVLGFVKLHPKATHIFRFEIAAENKAVIKQMVSSLAFLANDAVFVGYPYGLLVADQFARISNKEKDYLQTIFFNYAGSKEFTTTALNAHDILDRI